jgi:hypothetical protein
VSMRYLGNNQYGGEGVGVVQVQGSRAGTGAVGVVIFICFLLVLF